MIELNEPRIRVVMGAKRVFWASLTAAQVLKNEHARNRVKWPGPKATEAQPKRMTDLAARVMQNEINRQGETRHSHPVAAGERFGRLVVVSLALDAGVPLKWNCVCDCGVKKRIQHKHLIEGTRSCGCLRLQNSGRPKARKAAA